MESTRFQYILVLLHIIICFQSLIQCELIKQSRGLYCQLANIKRNENSSDNQPVKVCLHTEPELEASLEDNRLTLVHQGGIFVKFLCQTHSNIQPTTNLTWLLRTPKPNTDMDLPRQIVNMNIRKYAAGHGFKISNWNKTVSQAYFRHDTQELGNFDIKCVATFGNETVSIEAIIKDWGIPLAVGIYSSDYTDNMKVNESVRIWCRGYYRYINSGGYDIKDPEIAENHPIQFIFRDKDEKEFEPEKFGIELKLMREQSNSAKTVFELKHTRKLPAYSIQCKMMYNETIAGYSGRKKVDFYEELSEYY